MPLARLQDPRVLARALDPRRRAQHLQEEGEAFRGVAVVVDDQHAPLAPRVVHLRVRWRGRGSRRLHERQAHDELAAAAGPLAARFHGAAVHLGQPLHQREPDAEPALRVIDGAAHLGEDVVAELVTRGPERAVPLGIGAAQGYLLARPGPIDLGRRYDVAGLIDLAGSWWTPNPEPVPLVRAS